MPVIIDCGFTPQLTEKEVHSLSVQLSYCQSFNKSVDKPVNYIVTGNQEPLNKRLVTNCALNWGITITEKDYIDMFDKDRLVYLSGDATEEISELDPK